MLETVNDNYTVTWMFPKIGGRPTKWMVKIMVPNPMNKWMIWGVKPPIFGSTPTLMIITKFNICHIYIRFRIFLVSCFLLEIRGYQRCHWCQSSSEESKLGRHHREGERPDLLKTLDFIFQGLSGLYRFICER